MHKVPVPDVSRRQLLAMAGGLGTAAAAEEIATREGLLGVQGGTYTSTLPWDDGLTDAPQVSVSEGWQYLTPDEIAFLTAAADRIIPPDPTGPSASEAGVLVFLDRQLAGEYGSGAHFYLGGPWHAGTASQGYQGRFTPAQFYRHAIAAIQHTVARSEGGKPFHALPFERQDALLTEIEAGHLELTGPITSKDFFSMFIQNVREGYFSDPIYGGNKALSAWKMIGFPGAHYDYSEWVTAYDRPVPVESVGLRGRSAWERS